MEFEWYSIKGEKLEINDDGEYSDIPERCPECLCIQHENWKDFTANTVQVCPQCGTEMYIEYC